VRLTEMEPEATLAGLARFWVEIYSHASGSTDRQLWLLRI
jgi:hypothetical protein